MTHPVPAPGTSGRPRAPYREVTHDAYAARYTAGLRVEAAHGMAVLYGWCPRCGCAFTYTHTDRVFRAPRRGPRPAHVPVLCSCAADHPGRPPGETGCGAYWNVVLERR
ncbi:hypothetical protein [Streptomyces camelliae]|uniref:Uncharacterized protein n=1 Tax=Streptomyces camelliae TaxID=3004093 RepID=A0ABY7NX61_9ACTN|nr:hypothetical protein [Streptomyces sp. HUAS 2-6]WBO62825.1 hypothetical protein O1G22_08340 [Streptomyces sp. HUAS 2-6]